MPAESISYSSGCGPLASALTSAVWGWGGEWSFEKELALSRCFSTDTALLNGMSFSLADSETCLCFSSTQWDGPADSGTHFDFVT